MPFPTNASYPSHSGSYTPTIYAGKLIQNFYIATVFGAIANTDYEGDIKDKGDKVVIRTVPKIAIRDYEIGTGLTYDKPTPGKVDLNIDKGKYYAVDINDVQRLQSDVAYMDAWAKEGSEQLKIAVDSTVLGGLVGTAHASNKGATAGLISGNINLGATAAPVQLDKNNIVDFIVEMGQVLSEQNVPEADRWIVIPAWAATRIKTSELKDASLSGDGVSQLRNGRIGRIDHFTIYQSNNLPHVTDNTKECFYLYAGHKSALTFASQLVKNEVIKNPNDFGDLMRGLQVFGFENIKPEAFVQAYATIKVA